MIRQYNVRRNLRKMHLVGRMVMLIVFLLSFRLICCDFSCSAMSIVRCEFLPCFLIHLLKQLLEFVLVCGGISVFHAYDSMDK
jgi:membrane protein YqaA with SNARE-associated domain